MWVNRWAYLMFQYQNEINMLKNYRFHQEYGMEDIEE